MSAIELTKALRVVVITDRVLAGQRSVVDVIRAALEGGAPAVQLRNKGDTLREIVSMGHELRSLTRAAGALLFVNDRLDVALAIGADGVHLGPDDLPVAEARKAAPPHFLIGRSADDPTVARRAVEDGADYIGCGTVYATSTKKDAGALIGLDGLERVAVSVTVPVVAIGGITTDRAAEVAGTHAAGVAVVGAVMSATDPSRAVRELMAPFLARLKGR